MSWDLLLWGVEFTGTNPGAEPILIGTLWMHHYDEPYDDEPTRALLFQTRAKAREWCRKENADRGGLIFFRPVRVRETVEKTIDTCKEEV